MLKSPKHTIVNQHYRSRHYQLCQCGKQPCTDFQNMVAADHHSRFITHPHCTERTEIFYQKISTWPSCWSSQILSTVSLAVWNDVWASNAPGMFGEYHSSLYFCSKVLIFSSNVLIYLSRRYSNNKQLLPAAHDILNVLKFRPSVTSYPICCKLFRTLRRTANVLAWLWAVKFVAVCGCQTKDVSPLSVHESIWLYISLKEVVKSQSSILST